MSGSILLNLLALVCLLPAALLPLRPAGQRDGLFWAATAAAIAGSGAWALLQLSQAWQTDLGVALWVSIATTTILFAALAGFSRVGWRLAPLVMPYLLLLGLLASVISGRGQPMVASAPAVWLDLHILVSVLTYGLLTLAAMASLGVFLQERALKKKRPSVLTRMLPAVVEGESLSGRLLMAGQTILGLGIATGMATQYFETGSLLRLDHKALLSLVAFALIGALLLGHRVCGVRGRLAARVVLVAYLLVTLAYPGVKFVTQVLL
jgi:ABC-type uncharacterized transport system permease subunit